MQFKTNGSPVKLKPSWLRCGVSPAIERGREMELQLLCGWRNQEETKSLRFLLPLQLHSKTTAFVFLGCRQSESVKKITGWVDV